MTIPPSDLPNVIALAQRGHKEAIARLYRAYASLVYRYMLYRVPEGEVEDLTAEVFVKMVSDLPSYTYTGAPFEAWLYRIAAARVADYYRQQERHKTTSISENLPQDTLQPEEAYLQQQEIAHIRQLLEKLSEEQRTILLLRFVERKSHEEVALLIGKSVTAVKSLQHRALNRLAGLLGSSKIRHYLRGDT